MIRILGNVLRVAIIVAMGALMGWYVFQEGGWFPLMTALYFVAIGWFLSKAWKWPVNNKSVEPSASPLSSETARVASVVVPEDTTDRNHPNEPTIL